MLRGFHAQREKDLVDELKREQARSEAVEKRFNAVAAATASRSTRSAASRSRAPSSRRAPRGHRRRGRR